MKRIFILGFLAYIFILLFFLFQLAIGTKNRSLTVNNHKLTVEIADTDEKRAQGLSGRDKLGQNEGMLFTFPKKGLYNFWMKEMKFPLDFVWIDGDAVVDLTENVPAPETADLSTLDTFTSKYPADRVLEVNAGVIKSLNIMVGNKVEISR